MDKLVNIEDVFYILMNNITEVTLLKDIMNFKEKSEGLNIKKLPLTTVEKLLDVYSISNKDEIISKLVKEA